MARKKRRFQQPEVTTDQPKDKKVFRDSFQENVGNKLEDYGKKFEGKGKTILYGLAAVAVLAVLVGIFYVWNRRSDNAAQVALGKAIEISEAQISEQPAPAGSTVKVYKTEKERAEAAIAQFQTVVDKFGGSVGEKAKYFIAVNRLKVDRPAALQELETLANSGGDVGKVSKFALAQTRVEDGKLDEAATLYQELAALDDPIIAKATINLELAKIFEKQGKKQEAEDLYFKIAKEASEAKDTEDKPVPMNSTAREAKEKVSELNPERAKEIQEPAPESPLGGLPLGM